jgi:hypothetical protein
MLETCVGAAAVIVVVLGLSLSCASEGAEYVAPWSPDDWVCETVADQYEITDAEDRGRLCQLGDLVKGAAVTEDTMRAMLECLPQYDTAWRANLQDQFDGATAGELNAMIVDLTADGAACEATYDDYDDDTVGCPGLSH